MKISVVIPVFNAEPWLEATLASIRNQTEPVEFVVVDDCSQDNSAEMARSFIARHGLVGVVLRTAENQGPSNARNVGWQAASSEWIQFLDADDLLAPNKLERQLSVAAFSAADVAVLYSPWQHLSPADDDWGPSGPIIRSQVEGDPVTNILKDFRFGYVGPTLIRRRVLEQVGGFQPEMKITEDLDLMLRIAMAGYTFRSVESAEPLFFYRDTPGSLWRKATFDCDAAMRSCRAIRAADLYLRERNDHPTPVATRRAIALRYNRRLQTLRSCDASNFNLVISWISELLACALRRQAHLFLFASSLRSSAWTVLCVALLHYADCSL